MDTCGYPLKWPKSDLNQNIKMYTVLAKIHASKSLCLTFDPIRHWEQRGHFSLLMELPKCGSWASLPPRGAPDLIAWVLLLFLSQLAVWPWNINTNAMYLNALLWYSQLATHSDEKKMHYLLNKINLTQALRYCQNPIQKHNSRDVTWLLAHCSACPRYEMQPQQFKHPFQKEVTNVCWEVRRAKVLTWRSFLFPL